MGIAESSLENWGLTQASAYVSSLRSAFAFLADFPEAGINVGHIRPGYRKILSGSHFVFYRKTEDGVLIVRVLHERMDVERHL